MRLRYLHPGGLKHAIVQQESGFQLFDNGAGRLIALDLLDRFVSRRVKFFTAGAYFLDAVFSQYFIQMRLDMSDSLHPLGIIEFRR